MVNPGSLIWTRYDGLESRCYIPSYVEIGPPVPEKKIFWRDFTIYVRGGHLDHVTRMPANKLSPDHGYTKNLWAFGSGELKKNRIICFSCERFFFLFFCVCFWFLFFHIPLFRRESEKQSWIFFNMTSMKSFNYKFAYLCNMQPVNKAVEMVVFRSKKKMTTISILV